MYLRPNNVQDACAALAARRLTLLAGGTDHYASRVGRSTDEDILDLTGIAALRGIRKRGAGWRIGATTTWTDVIEARLPPAFDALKLAAREVGGHQVQNAGTIAGNIANASPAADGIPPLLALDAEIELRSTKVERAVPLAEFMRGPRKTALAPDELITAVLIPPLARSSRSSFLKLGARKYLLISIAMVAVVLETKGSKILRARIAVGACSPVARRLTGLENDLSGCVLGKSLESKVKAAHLSPLQPIDDVRASAEYRLDAALTLVRRALREAASA